MLRGSRSLDRPRSPRRRGGGRRRRPSLRGRAHWPRWCSSAWHRGPVGKGEAAVCCRPPRSGPSTALWPIVSGQAARPRSCSGRASTCSGHRRCASSRAPAIGTTASVLVLSFPSSYRAATPPHIELRRVVGDDDADLAMRLCSEQWPASVGPVGRAIEHATCFLAVASGRIRGSTASAGRAGLPFGQPDRVGRTDRSRRAPSSTEGSAPPCSRRWPPTCGSPVSGRPMSARAGRRTSSPGLPGRRHPGSFCPFPSPRLAAGRNSTPETRAAKSARMPPVASFRRRVLAAH